MPRKKEDLTPLGILKMLGEDKKSQAEVAEELGVKRAALTPYIHLLKEEGLVKTNNRGTLLTRQGEELYSEYFAQDEASDQTPENELSHPNSLTDIHDCLSDVESIEVFDLLNQGYSKEEIVSTTSHDNLERYLDMWEEEGLFRSGYVTEEGREIYERLLKRDTCIELL